MRAVELRSTKSDALHRTDRPAQCDPVLSVEPRIEAGNGSIMAATNINNADRELTAEDENKLDRLQAILAMFAEINKIIDLPMMRVMALVCRHEGESIKELTPRTPGYPLSVVSRLTLDLGAGIGDERSPAHGLMEQRGDDPRLYLTPKGIEFRDRLLSLLDPELAQRPPRRLPVEGALPSPDPK
jgi:hypothetical protein